MSSNANDTPSRFGSGQRCSASKTRRCSPATATSPTTSPRRPACIAFLRSPHAHARIVAIDTRGRVGDARRARGLHRRRAGRRPASSRCRWRCRLQARRRLARRSPRRAARWRTSACASSARRWRRWSPRAATRRATRPKRSWSTTRSCPRSPTRCAAIGARRAALCAEAGRQHRRRDAPRRRRGRPRRPSHARPRTWSARHRQPAPRAGADGAAQRARRVRRRDAAADRPPVEPDADRACATACAMRPRPDAGRRCAWWSATSAAASA